MLHDSCYSKLSLATFVRRVHSNSCMICAMAVCHSLRVCSACFMTCAIAVCHWLRLFGGFIRTHATNFQWHFICRAVNISFVSSHSIKLQQTPTPLTADRHSVNTTLTTAVHRSPWQGTSQPQHHRLIVASQVMKPLHALLWACVGVLYAIFALWAHIALWAPVLYPYRLCEPFPPSSVLCARAVLPSLLISEPLLLRPSDLIRGLPVYCRVARVPVGFPPNHVVWTVPQVTSPSTSHFELALRHGNSLVRFLGHAHHRSRHRDCLSGSLDGIDSLSLRVLSPRRFPPTLSPLLSPCTFPPGLPRLFLQCFLGIHFTFEVCLPYHLSSWFNFVPHLDLWGTNRRAVTPLQASSSLSSNRFVTRDEW